MSYLNPPPAPAPVIVVKDVGGLVRDYQAQTEFYRRTDREVRVHECHSACTLVLSLPNVCVYPDSIFKFHQAYNEITRQTDYGVSDELFTAYPGTVRARLGTLTRQFKVMRGTELIALGIRDCNTPRTIIAAAHPSSDGPLQSPSQEQSLGAVWSDMMAAFGNHATPPGTSRAKATLVATRKPTDAERHRMASLATLPPPTRTASLESPVSSETSQLAEARTPDAATAEADIPVPPPRPMTLTASMTQPLPIQAMPAQAMPTASQPAPMLPKVMAGAQPILPPHFLAYAVIARLNP